MTDSYCYSSSSSSSSDWFSCFLSGLRRRSSAWRTSCRGSLRCSRDWRSCVSCWGRGGRRRRGSDEEELFLWLPWTRTQQAMWLNLKVHKPPEPIRHTHIWTWDDPRSVLDLNTSRTRYSRCRKRPITASHSVTWARGVQRLQAPNVNVHHVCLSQEEVFPSGSNR